MQLPMIRSAADVAALVEEMGFLPFFRHAIPGFSIAECCPPELWFSDTQDGPWEWKGPVIRQTGCAYGKFFRGKACFISREWFLDFANYRRDGYDYDARVDEGLARHRDLRIMEVLTACPTSMLSKELKERSCAGEDSRKQFDSCVTALQMQGYITTADFSYATAKNGKTYGWGMARYATPETFFGGAFTARVYATSPENSREKIRAHLEKLLPEASLTQIDRLIG